MGNLSACTHDEDGRLGPRRLDFEPEADWGATYTHIPVDGTGGMFDALGNFRQRVIVQSCIRNANDELDNIEVCMYAAHHAQDPTLVEYLDPGEHGPYFFDAHQHEINDSDPTLAPGEPEPDDPDPDEEDPPAGTDGDDDDPDTPPVHRRARALRKKKPNYSLLRPLFGWLSTIIIQATLAHTTQYGRMPTGTALKRTYRTPNPVFNIPRRDEPTASDIVYADVPAIDDGSTMGVIFAGTQSKVTDVYGVKTERQFVNTLEDNIRDRGAPTKLISDGGSSLISEKVKHILRALFIRAWQSEPHQQQQNPAERRWQTVQSTANTILDRTGAPAYTWLLCLKYVCYLLNHCWDATIRNVPLTALTGVTVDISPLLRFHFWQPVYFRMDDDDAGFPSDSKEVFGHIVGISEHCGHMMTWKVLSHDTKKVMNRSRVRAVRPDERNFRAERPRGETDSREPIIKSAHDSSQTPVTPDMLRTVYDDEQPETDPTPGETKPEEPKNEQVPRDTPVFKPEDLVGRTFLMDEQNDGQRFQARIVKLIEDHESDLDDNPTRIKFVCSINNDQAEEVFVYNELLDYISRDEESEIVWKFKRIVSHKGPLKR